MGNIIQAKNLESSELESNVLSKKIDIYEDWEVDRYNNIVRYSTQGSIDHGHRFGWIKKAGNCDTDILATTISTKKINKERLYDFKGESIDLRINFPQAEGEDSAIINTDLISVFDFATLKIAFFGNFIQGQMFDSLMKFKKLPKDTKVYCGHEYTKKNSDFCLTHDINNNNLKTKIHRIDEKLKRGLPTVPSTIKDELECNIFLRSNNVETFSKLRYLKDNF